MYSYYSELSKFEMYEIKEVFNIVIYFSGVYGISLEILCRQTFNVHAD